jgi:thiamine biosynthesis lipoprotein
MVGIRDPRHLDVVVAMLPLQDEALSTSGDYERYFEEDGVRYHHIIDPGTGGSAGALTSVSVLGPDATTTDALSTSLFVMGVRKGMALVDSLDGIEAIMVDRSGELYFSDGLASVDRESTAR